MNAATPNKSIAERAHERRMELARLKQQAAIKEREADREARRLTWLAAQLENINSAICHSDAIELLREACEEWERLD